jgi:hypothetical protein
MFSLFAKSPLLLPKPELSGSEIVAIIEAGNLANAAAISYNGLNITYKPLTPDPVVADSTFYASPLPSSPLEQVQDEPVNNKPAAHDLDTIMLTDPLEYERLIHEEDNAR